MSMTVSVPPGKATAVGGEPGITKAVLSRIQVLSLCPEDLPAHRADLGELLKSSLQQGLTL